MSDCITAPEVSGPGTALLRIGTDLRLKDGIGAGDRIRTGDIDLGKVALYQLSYSRARGGKDLKDRIHCRASCLGKSNAGAQW